MAYRLEIESDFDRTPVVDAFEGQTIRFLLGVDFDADFLVYMTVLLMKKEEGVFEIRFGTEERRLSRDGYSEGLDYSIEQSRRYISKEYRPIVLKLLLTAIEALVRSVGPRSLRMRSFYKKLPGKALSKYGRIAKLMKRLGYTTYEHVDEDGTRHWLFRLEK
jgi:hypothetical protein